MMTTVIDPATGETTVVDIPHWDVLIADKFTLLADDTDVARIEYRTDFHPDGTEVTFTVNGATVTETILGGKAEIEVTAAAPGPIVVSVPAGSLNLTAVLP